MFMLEQIRNNYVNICIAAVYTILAMLVYGVWSYSAWELWYVTFIIVIAILGTGITISYFWIKSEIKSNNIKQEEQPKL